MTTTSTLETPGAGLYYEVRGAGPLVVLVGAPMNAQSFAPLADLLAADHTVLTTDPRGIGRSPLEDPTADSTPEQRAGDLARLIRNLDAGPAIVLGSSGGAVSTLALAQHHPELVRTAIAHEPPLEELLDDRDRQRELADDLVATYLGGDVLGAWRKFFVQANIQLPDEMIEVMFGGERDPQVVADERFWFEHELRPSVRWQPDLDALTSGPVHIVVGIGEESADQLCDWTSRALAKGLSIDPTFFPGGHIGFVDDPDAFAARLRTVLSGC
ncbi:pimeloyl-ACP methyl ester carboxylesterase [Kribbella sp. VKM Ac-2527]|uniref:Pimeloyl-ACP methyl ester carboxylesterase n=1 Tax=Kribbella caucasensis TaxID=2512215 RepID=A0A4R6KCX8_9ACTN|nr:alpha/beta hydrolase [Kribbella sp. VKM Ac-2527]TDO45685.1 pimeloyl-ACP methyl ester carboxylesterase [Kribbella sp. VKM Ac-2527]